MVTPRRKWAAFVRILCAVALLCVGLAHQPPVPAVSSLSLETLAQYTLPDGSLPIICLSGEGDDGKQHSSGLGPGCEACRLNASTLLPPPTHGGERMRRVLAVMLPPRMEAFQRQLFPPNASPRGPPLSGLTA